MARGKMERPRKSDLLEQQHALLLLCETLLRKLGGVIDLGDHDIRGTHSISITNLPSGKGIRARLVVHKPPTE